MKSTVLYNVESFSLTMSVKTKTINLNLNKKIPHFLITSKWKPPIEAFVKQNVTEPICKMSEITEENIRFARSKLSPTDVLLAHETTPTRANEILSSGFKPMVEGAAEIRDHAVFGWVHKPDIGHYNKTEMNDNANIVLFKTPKEHVYVSSYENSARQIIYGEITEEAYESKHVLSYSTYETLYWEHPEWVSHLNYSIDSFLT